MSIDSKLGPYKGLYIVSAVLFAAGLLSGSLALSTAEASVPPLQWDSIAIIAIVSAVGISFVLGIQSGLKNWRAFKIAWHFFFCACCYLLGCGISALALSFYRSTFGPPAMLFIAMVIGLFTGLGICRSLAGR